MTAGGCAMKAGMRQDKQARLTEYISRASSTGWTMVTLVQKVDVLLCKAMEVLVQSEGYAI